MSKYWIEKYNSSKHKNKMWGEGIKPPEGRHRTLDPYNVYFVRECSFTFEFHSISQLDACIQHFSRKLQPSTKIPGSELDNYGSDYWERQRWFESLPKGLVSNHQRPKILKALEKAKIYFKKNN